MLMRKKEEEKKIPIKAIVCVKFVHSPYSAWVFWVFQFPLTVHIGLSGISKWSACESGCLCEWPNNGRVSCPGWVPPCTLNCWERLWPPITLNWNKHGTKECLTCFLFILLNVCRAHFLFQCLMLEVFNIKLLTLEVWSWLCDKKHAIES